MSTTVQYKGSTIATVSGETKKLTTKGKWLEDDISITASPESENGSVYQDEDGYVVLDDEPGVNVSVAPLSVTSNGTYTAPTGIAYTPVSVNVQPSLQSKSATPSETAQTITPDSGYYGLSKVSVGAISSTYVGSGIAKKSSADLTASGATITAPAGYYSSAASKAVATTTHPNPTASINSTTGVVTASHTQGTGYVTGGTTTGTLSLTTQAAKTVTPTESSQTAVAAGRYTTGAVTVGAISSTYVGSGVAKKSSTDLTASGATVTAPAGYYSSAATKTVATATQATPSVSINSSTGLITATATQTAGYVTAGTKNGTLQLTSKGATTYTPNSSAQTIAAGTYLTGTQTIEAIPSAYIIPSGTITISSAGTFDVKNYASAQVNASPKIEPLTVTPSDTEQIFVAGEQEEQIATKLSTDNDATTTWSINLASSFSNGDNFKITGRIGRNAGQYSFQNEVAVDETFVWDSQSHVFNYTYTGGGYTYTLTINTNSIVITANCATDYELTIYKVKIVDGYAPVTVEAAESGGGGDVTIDQIATRKISGNISGNASSIYSYAFYGCNNLTTANFPSCTSIGANAFSYCGNLTTANFPSCTSIGANAFFYCTLLTSISFPVCTSIAGSAFYGCSNLATANFPSCTYIGANAFFCCALLTSISFPVCTSIAGSAFFTCSNLTTANFPSCRSIGISTFCRCYNLATANFPVCTSIGNGAFENCTSLTSISFPVCTYMGMSAFQYCTHLTTADFPSCSSIGSYAFRGCTNLTTADFPSCRSIGSYAFSNCTNLISLYLSGISSIPTLANVAAFSSTPIGGYSTVAGQYGSVFVPSSLYESFLTATNWSTISSRIVSV